MLLIGVSYMPVRAEGNLRVVDSKTTVRRGETGFITIQGKPNTQYTIETTYKVSGQVINGTQTRTSGGDGRITFRWRVSPQTESGTRSALIAGGGEHITLSHTVP